MLALLKKMWEIENESRTSRSRWTHLRGRRKSKRPKKKTQQSGIQT